MRFHAHESMLDFLLCDWGSEGFLSFLAKHRNITNMNDNLKGVVGKAKEILEVGLSLCLQDVCIRAPGAIIEL